MLFVGSISLLLLQSAAKSLFGGYDCLVATSYSVNLGVGVTFAVGGLWKSLALNK